MAIKDLIQVRPVDSAENACRYARHARLVIYLMLSNRNIHTIANV